MRVWKDAQAVADLTNCSSLDSAKALSFATRDTVEVYGAESRPVAAGERAERAEMVVKKLNSAGEVTFAYTAELAERLPNGVQLEARWTRPPLELGYVTFETGDAFVEWFFTDCWYNIFEIHASNGELKGWYCNVAEPATISAGVVACRDLLLDLWVGPEGEMEVLDEEEFAEADLDATTRARALEALAELQGLVRERTTPFHAAL